jgi:hypothetical protein
VRHVLQHLAVLHVRLGRDVRGSHAIARRRAERDVRGRGRGIRGEREADLVVAFELNVAEQQDAAQHAEELVLLLALDACSHTVTRHHAS